LGRVWKNPQSCVCGVSLCKPFRELTKLDDSCAWIIMKERLGETPKVRKLFVNFGQEVEIACLMFFNISPCCGASTLF